MSHFSIFNVCTVTSHCKEILYTVFFSDSICHYHFTLWEYIDVWKLHCLPLAAVCGSEKNWLWWLWKELVGCADLERLTVDARIMTAILPLHMQQSWLRLVMTLVLSVSDCGILAKQSQWVISVFYSLQQHVWNIIYFGICLKYWRCFFSADESS